MKTMLSIYFGLAAFITVADVLGPAEVPASLKWTGPLGAAALAVAIFRLVVRARSRK